MGLAIDLSPAPTSAEGSFTIVFLAMGVEEMGATWAATMALTRDLGSCLWIESCLDLRSYTRHDWHCFCFGSI